MGKRCTNKLNIGLMGGTFDPIHIGHLVAAEEAREQFNLHKVIFVPVGLPPHKKRETVTAPEHRYLMTCLAATSNPAFDVSRAEIDRDGPSFTIDTVRYFKSREEGAELYFITGADAILEILSWKNYGQILEMCKFIAVTRPGYDLSRLRDTLGIHCREVMQKVFILEVPALAISSTFIRERAARGKTIKYLTPEAVEQYIHRHGLYRLKK